MRLITIILKFLKENIVNIVSIFVAIGIIFADDRSSTIAFLDVGQGDSILIQKNNFQILIDGGPDNTVLFEISKYMNPLDRRIEIVVLTHPHADHIKGLLYVIENYEIGEVWINRIDYDLQDYKYLLESDVVIKDVKLGDGLRYEDLLLEVIYPFDSDEQEQDPNINNESIVLKVEIGDTSLLLMGDAEHEVENKLLDKDLIAKTDILKAGHHCSRTATSKSFIESSSPGFAICSLGENNKFGHPHDETLVNLQTYSVQHLTTSEQGNIVFRFK